MPVGDGQNHACGYQHRDQSADHGHDDDVPAFFMTALFAECALGGGGWRCHRRTPVIIVRRDYAGATGRGGRRRRRRRLGGALSKTVGIRPGWIRRRGQRSGLVRTRHSGIVRACHGGGLGVGLGASHDSLVRYGSLIRHGGVVRTRHGGVVRARSRWIRVCRRPLPARGTVVSASVPGRALRALRRPLPRILHGILRRVLLGSRLDLLRGFLEDVLIDLRCDRGDDRAHGHADDRTGYADFGGEKERGHRSQCPRKYLRYR